MNDLMISERKTVASPLDLATDLELLHRAYSDIRDCFTCGKHAISAALDKALKINTADLSSRVSDARCRVSRDEIVLHVAKMLGAMKHLGKVDEDIFPEQLVDDIEDFAPSRAALVSGIRQVRLNCAYLPSIAETLKAIREAEANYKLAADRIERLPSLIAEAESKLK